MIFIHGQVPTWKNQKQHFSAAKAHYLQDKWILAYSAKDKTVRMAKDAYCKRKNNKTGKLEFHSRLEPYPFQALKDLFQDKPKPLLVGFHFVRQDKRACDFSNLVQFVDLWIAGGVIEDDSMDYFYPMPMLIDGKFYSVDKENPGVWIDC